MEELTEKEKIEFLRKRGWKVFEGYCFDFVPASDFDNVVIEVEEVFKKIKKGCKWFCQETDDNEYLYDLDDAIDEYERDYVEMELDEELSDEEYLKFIRKTLENGNKHRN